MTTTTNFQGAPTIRAMRASNSPPAVTLVLVAPVASSGGDDAARAGDDLDHGLRAQVLAVAVQQGGPGDYLCTQDAHEVMAIPLLDGHTRIGRSLSADVRFEDPTVSRRHALIVRDPAGVRVLDDHSLNGVFVNGRRVDRSLLADGDEIRVGRHTLSYRRFEGRSRQTGEAELVAA